MKLRQILNEITNDAEIRLAAWLYLLVFPYNGTMKLESWINDSRMGIKFGDAVKALESKKLVIVDDQTAKSTSAAKNYLFKIFGKFDNEDDAIEYSKKFKKYDTPKYHISSIPVDIFEHEYENQVSKNRELNRPKYYDLIKWIEKHQRDSSINFKSSFKELLGDSNLVDQSRTYNLYRGIYISKNNSNYDQYVDLKIGDKISNKNLSWTWSKGMAQKFAKGSTNWADAEKFKPGDISIILKHSFDHTEILCDLYYIDKQGYSFIDFPDEKEVIVLPKTYSCQIFEIIK